MNHTNISITPTIGGPTQKLSHLIRSKKKQARRVRRHEEQMFEKEIERQLLEECPDEPDELDMSVAKRRLSMFTRKTNTVYPPLSQRG